MRLRATLATCLLLFLTISLSATTIEDSVNASLTPGIGPSYAFVVPDVGWYYTAPSSYTLTGINFNFSATDSGSVTEELFDTTTPALGGTLLASSSFSPSGAGFAGGSFAPVSIVAGHTYFVGILGVMGFDGMTSSDASAVLLPESFDTGSGNFEDACTGCPSSTKVMLQFVFTPSTTTPEPSTLALLGTGLLGLIGTLRKRF